MRCWAVGTGLVLASVALLVAAAHQLRPTDYWFFEFVPFHGPSTYEVSGEWDRLFAGPAQVWCRTQGTGSQADCLVVPLTPHQDQVVAALSQAGWVTRSTSYIFVDRRRRWWWEPDLTGFSQPYCPAEVPDPSLAGRCAGAGPLRVSSATPPERQP